MRGPILYILPLLLAFIMALTSTQVSAVGFLPVRNFKRDTYSAGPQNWCVAQDSIGRVCIANRDGMLLFDGSHWHPHPLPNFTTVRSLYYDQPSGRIYAGGSEDFGYFESDPHSGLLKFTSLLPAFGNTRPTFSEVWNIFISDSKIWFQTDFKLFRYDPKENKINSFPTAGRISRSALIGRHILVALEDGRLTEFRNNRFEPMPGCESLKGKKIMAILPYSPMPGTLLLPTSTDGLFIHDGQRAYQLDSELNPFLKENQVFCACCCDNDYVFGTVTHGAVVKNFLTGSISYINKESGMQNNTVLSASFDRNHNIWLCLDNGIDYAIYNSAISNLISPSSDVGAGYVSCRYKDKVLFGTNQGLYSSSYPFQVSPHPIPLTRELTGQIWSIEEMGDWLFVSGDAGVFAGRGNGFAKVEGPGGTLRVIAIDEHPDMVLASTYDQFHLLRLSDGSWKDLGPIKGYNDIGGKFVRDRNGYIWLSHWRKGIYRLHLDIPNMRFDEVKLFNNTNGLPASHNNSVSLQSGRVLISTTAGIYTYDYKTETIVPDRSLREIFSPGMAGTLTLLPNGDMAKSLIAGLEIARRSTDGRYSPDLTRISLPSDKLIPGYEHLCALSRNEIILSTQDGFWCVNPDYNGRRSSLPTPFVNAVFANRDSMVYCARPDGRLKEMINLRYELNSLRFELAAPQFQSPDGVEFSSMLDNYDDEWSPFATEASREYTHLDEGSYTLRLRTRNPQTGKITEAAFPFRILPPWYRSGWAKSLYVLLTLGILALLGLWIRSSIMKTQERMKNKKEEEMERLRKKAEREALVKDVEIANLKSEQLQQDVRHKSHELSSTTMNLIRKNEILQEISDKIARLQASSDIGSSPSLQKQLKSIQSDISDNISHDDDWKSFTQNFDVVYENFNRRLIERHPNLSPADKRLCCYLKMGLSSKEIAPLISISTKSVEMARYRLRKKLELPTETGLAEYLSSL